MNDRVQKLDENCFVVAVPVYFTVTLDENGNAQRVEQSGSDRKWFKGQRNCHGKVYTNGPSGLLAEAAAVARAAALAEKHAKEGTDG